MIYDLNYYELPDLSKSKLLREKKKEGGGMSFLKSFKSNRVSESMGKPFLFL